MTINLFYIFFILIFFSSYTVIIYKSYAEKFNLPIGSLFDKILFITFFGTLALTVSFVIAFFYIKWYIVIILVIFSSLISGFVVRILKSWIQLTTILSYLVALILLFFI